MITNRLIDTRIELIAGSAVVDAMDIAKETNLTFVYKDNMIALTKAGIYRFDSEPARLKVFQGNAEVKTANSTVTVGSGKALTLSGSIAVAEKFDTKQTDSLDHWSRRRDELMAISNVSAANQARRGMGSSNPCGGMGGGNARNHPSIMHLGSWGYNPYYGLATYIPCNGRLSSPYGYYYWSPMAVYRQFYAPRPVFNPTPSGMGGGGYPTMGASPGGYSGGVGSSGSGGSVASAPAAASSGSSSASSAGSSSVGGGASGGGGRGQ
jgi:hypothetical protein